MKNEHIAILGVVCFCRIRCMLMSNAALESIIIRINPAANGTKMWHAPVADSDEQFMNLGTSADPIF